jgi:16S rRNA (guanine527-N7)-methyltransferase
MSLVEPIKDGAARLDVNLADEALEKAAAFIELLSKWNRVTNLTAVRDPAQMVAYHLLDAFAVQPWITGQRILDVGSGGGIPGVPLALINPDKDFILLDSNGKKTRFMVQAKVELALDNVEVIQSRIEDHETQYDQIISRAFTSLDQYATCCLPLLVDRGSLLAMKGPDQAEELAAMERDNLDIRINALQVPGVQGERFLIELKAVDQGPEVNSAR